MPSLSTIFFIATTAFSAFTSAAPTIADNGVASYPPYGIKAVSSDIGKRCDTCSTVPGIFANVQAQVSVISEKLDAIVAVKAEIEAEVLTPCLLELKGILVQAVVDVRALIGLELDVILAVDGKVLALIDVCHLFISLLSLIVAILNLCLRVVIAVKVQVILAIVADIGCVVAELVAALFVCIKGLDVVLCPILVSLLPTLRALVFVDLIAIIKA